MTDSFIALDFETANHFRGSVCQIGMTKVRNGSVVETVSSLVKPPSGFDDFDPYNVMIHGISSSDVRTSPELIDLLPSVLEFIDGLPLVAHNAAFDTGAFRDALDVYKTPYPDLTYFCTLVLSRKALNLVSYSLDSVAQALEVPLVDHHDAGQDAEASARIALKLLEQTSHSTLAELAESYHVRPGQISATSWQGCRSKQPASDRFSPERIAQIRAALGDSELDLDNEITGRNVVFTGTLGSMTKSEAWARVEAVGGFPQAGVTKHTDVLVFGVQDPAHLRPGAENSNKYMKAVELQAKGQAIEVIDEVTFLRLMYGS